VAKALDGHPRLRLTGYRSAENVDAVFSSCMVDVAYVVGTSSDAVFIAADDPAWPADRADYDWLCSIITEELASHGIKGVELSLVPKPSPSTDAERGDVADGEK
jgi:hypothetical protein